MLLPSLQTNCHLVLLNLTTTRRKLEEFATLNILDLTIYIFIIYKHQKYYFRYPSSMGYGRSLWSRLPKMNLGCTLMMRLLLSSRHPSIAAYRTSTICRPMPKSSWVVEDLQTTSTRLVTNIWKCSPRDHIYVTPHHSIRGQLIQLRSKLQTDDRRFQNY